MTQFRGWAKGTLVIVALLVTLVACFRSPAPSEPDLATTAVISSTPSNGQNGVAAASPIVLNFAAAMNRQNVERSLSFFEGSYNPSANPSSFTPLELTFICNGVYKVTNPNAVDISFNWEAQQNRNRPLEKGVGVVQANSSSFFYTSTQGRNAKLYVNNQEQPYNQSNQSPCNQAREKGTLSWSNGNTTLSYNPSPATLDNRDYTLVISNLGVATSEAFVLQFSTKAEASPLPDPWQELTLGDGTATASYNPDTATFSSNLSATGESTHFIYQSLATNATLTARVQQLMPDANSKAGLMLRQSTDPASPFVYVYVNQTGIHVDYLEGGELSSVAHGASSQPVWLRLMKEEDRVYVYESDDGVSFTLITTIMLSLVSPYQLGLATSVTNASTQATFDNVLLAEADTEEETITVTETVGPAGGIIRVFFQGEDRIVEFPADALLYEVPVTVTVTNIPDTSYPDDPQLQRSYPPELLEYISPNITVELPRDALDWRSDDLLKELLWVETGLNADIPGKELLMRTEIRIELMDGVNTLNFRAHLQGGFETIYTTTLQLFRDDLPEFLRISFQVVDETALYPGTSSLQQQGLGMLTTPPFATYAEGVIRLKDDYTSQDFRTHCSGTSQTMPVQPLTGAISTNPDKTPLLLIHGWTGLGQIVSVLSQNPLRIDDIIELSRYAPAFCYWKDFILNFNDDPDVSQSLSLAMLRESYELYSFAYDSQQPIARNVDKLREALSQFNQPVVILGHSMGAVIANTYVQSYEKEEVNKVRHIITAGAPYMGSTIMLCQRVDNEACLEAIINIQVVEIFLVGLLLDPTTAAIRLAVITRAQDLFQRISRYPGSRDLSWQFSGFSVASRRDSTQSVANPYLTTINSNNTPNRNTTFYGDATEGSAPFAEGALAAALKLVSGYPNDSVVPIDSACLSAQPSNVPVYCSGIALPDLLYREGFSHGEIHTSRNLSAITVELLRLSGRLLDIDDGTPDGNQRVYIGNEDSEAGCADTNGGFGGDGVCDAALTENKPLIYTDFDFGGRFEMVYGRLRRLGEDADNNGRIGDGELIGRVYQPRVTMADFRRWRDVYLEYNTGAILDGSAFHPKKNPNGERIAPSPNLVCEVGFNCAFPIFGDFNGDGIVDLNSRMPVAGVQFETGMPIDVNSTPYLTDLEVFYYLTKQNNWWDDEIPMPSLEELTTLVSSGDIEVWPYLLLKDQGVDYVESRVISPSGNYDQRFTHRRNAPRHVYTVPVTTNNDVFEVHVQAFKQGNQRPVFSFTSTVNLQVGGNTLIDMCSPSWMREITFGLRPIGGTITRSPFIIESTIGDAESCGAFVQGYANSSLGKANFLLRLSSEGELLWNHRLPQGATIKHVQQMSNGNIFVLVEDYPLFLAASPHNATGTGEFLIEIDPDGTYLNTIQLSSQRVDRSFDRRFQGPILDFGNSFSIMGIRDFGRPPGGQWWFHTPLMLKISSGSVINTDDLSTSAVASYYRCDWANNSAGSEAWFWANTNMFGLSSLAMDGAILNISYPIENTRPDRSIPCGSGRTLLRMDNSGNISATIHVNDGRNDYRAVKDVLRTDDGTVFMLVNHFQNGTKLWYFQDESFSGIQNLWNSLLPRITGLPNEHIIGKFRGRSDLTGLEAGLALHGATTIAGHHYSVTVSFFQTSASWQRSFGSQDYKAIAGADNRFLLFNTQSIVELDSTGETTFSRMDISLPVRDVISTSGNNYLGITPNGVFAFSTRKGLNFDGTPIDIIVSQW